MAAETLTPQAGGDRFEAQLIAEACRAAGSRVQPPTADDSGVRPRPGMARGHRLLVAVADAGPEQAIADHRSRPRR